MKQIKNSLEFKVWCYLIGFSVIILFFLWFFQVVSLKSYYELSTKKEINKVVKQVKNNYDDIDYEDIFNKLSFNTDTCIELYDGTLRVYSSFSCNTKSIEFSQEKRDFILKNYDSQGYEIEDNSLNNKVLLYGVKLDSGKYAFVQASLIPVDSTVSILKKQLVIVSVVVCSLSLLVAIFISKKISKPIEEINENAKKLAKGKYDLTFKDNSTINEINELNSTLNYTSRELAKTENLRRELLSNVSHDLKTPLTMIKAYAEMVRDLTYKNKKKREQDLNVIINETDRLNLLVNDILDLSKYQSNTIKLEYSEFDIDELIENILKQYIIYEEKDGYEINYKRLGKINVIADRKRIEQVLYNLINNALNYTGSDKKIYIRLIDNKETDRVRIEISDTGEGIDKKDIPLIWDRYYKVDKTYSRIQIGSGIGLSIVKNILQLHNVIYGVESTLNVGTTFYFELIRSTNNK